MIGILMAGGKGKRLLPSTSAISKHLFPIYDKPMIYYSLSIFFMCKIKNVIIIADENNILFYKKLLGNGEKFGIKLDYLIQNNANGIAEGILISESFIKGKKICLVLGDNILYGDNLINRLLLAKRSNLGATIFGYFVKNPSDYGVAKFDKKKNIVDIIEKPKKFISNYAIPGIYFYDENVLEYTKKLKPSRRGELEISSLNKQYLLNNKMKINLLGRGFAWLDTGTNESLLEASNFVYTIEKRQGLKIACLEELAYNNKWINISQLNKIINSLEIESDYRNYLIKVRGGHKK